MTLGPARLRSTLLTSVGIAAIAAVCFFVFHSNATIAAIVLLLGVLLAGAYASRTEAVTGSICATLCLDYFFIPPIRQIAIADPQGWVILCIFLAVSLIATNLSSRLRRQRDELIARQRESDKLHALSRAILLNNGGEDLRRLLVNKCIELFAFDEAVLFESASGEFYRSQANGVIPIEDLRKAALYGSIARDEKRPDGTTILAITLGNKILGSFAFNGPALREAALQSLGNTIGVGLAQAQAQEAGSRAEAVRKSEELKSIMIDALAHELKTPMTAIGAAVDVLQDWATVSPAQRQDLLQVIHEEASRLQRLMNEAIHLARIEAKRLRLECEPLRVDQLVTAAIQSLGARAASHPIELDLNGPEMTIFADRELMLQLLKQLLDNAIKYSPLPAAIRVSANEANGLVSISVRDRGQGLTELERRRVFEKFYRARRETSAVQGTGMGLAIAREIAEAHGGSITVESQQGQGSRFTVTLQSAAARALAEPQTA